MLSMRLLSRSNLPQYGATIQRFHTSTLLHDAASSSSSSDSDKKSTKKKLKTKPAQSEEEKVQSRLETTDRLNSLLEKMMKEPKVPKKLDLSMPPKKPKSQPKKTEKKQYEATLLDAAKKVATSLGGDVQKIESDLLKKLQPNEKIISNEKSKSDQEKKDELPNTSLNLSELLAGMKIDRTPQQSSMPSHAMQRSHRAQTVAKKFESTRPTRFESWSTDSRSEPTGPTEPGNLYNGRPLNCFNESEKLKKLSDIPRLETWEILEKKEFKLAMTHPPENIFQEMIMWTEQGKLWKFPVDNEQGLEEEQSIHFSEHVFVERCLQDWCPKRGPIRHFMELVCVGLSKNPYMTVNEKKEHIAWYREYFGSKQELLKELGAIETEIPMQSKQIQA